MGRSALSTSWRQRGHLVPISASLIYESLVSVQGHSGAKYIFSSLCQKSVKSHFVGCAAGSFATPSLVHAIWNLGMETQVFIELEGLSGGDEEQ